MKKLLTSLLLMLLLSCAAALADSPYDYLLYDKGWTMTIGSHSQERQMCFYPDGTGYMIESHDYMTMEGQPFTMETFYHFQWNTWSDSPTSAMAYMHIFFEDVHPGASWGLKDMPYQDFTYSMLNNENFCILMDMTHTGKDALGYDADKTITLNWDGVTPAFSDGTTSAPVPETVPEPQGTPIKDGSIRIYLSYYRDQDRKYIDTICSWYDLVGTYTCNVWGKYQRITGVIQAPMDTDTVSTAEYWQNNNVPIAACPPYDDYTFSAQGAERERIQQQVQAFCLNEMNLIHACHLCHYVEIYADDVLVYTSPSMLYRSEGVAFDVNVNGAETIVFKYYCPALAYGASNYGSATIQVTELYGY